jgi:hypothetical protein
MVKEELAALQNENSDWGGGGEEEAARGVGGGWCGGGEGSGAGARLQAARGLWLAAAAGDSQGMPLLPTASLRVCAP